MADRSPTQPLAEATAASTLKVRTRDGDALGTIHSFLVHKASGRVTHAVLGLGGMLGMGKSYYPVPYELLSYDGSNDLYVVTIDRRMLEGGPSWANNAPDFDQAYSDRVASYYGVRSERLDSDAGSLR